jgi:hypothetical protein
MGAAPHLHAGPRPKGTTSQLVLFSGDNHRNGAPRKDK